MHSSSKLKKTAINFGNSDHLHSFNLLAQANTWPSVVFCTSWCHHHHHHRRENEWFDPPPQSVRLANTNNSLGSALYLCSSTFSSAISFPLLRSSCQCFILHLCVVQIANLSPVRTLRLRLHTVSSSIGPDDDDNDAYYEMDRICRLVLSLR